MSNKKATHLTESLPQLHAIIDMDNNLTLFDVSAYEQLQPVGDWDIDTNGEDSLAPKSAPKPAPKNLGCNSAPKLSPKNLGEIASYWSREEIELAIATLQELIYVFPQATLPDEKVEDIPKDIESHPGSTIEIKEINGNFYEYLRWRENGVHRSKYLGKANLSQ